jgi:hypothetical protein
MVQERATKVEKISGNGHIKGTRVMWKKNELRREGLV